MTDLNALYSRGFYDLNIAINMPPYCHITENLLGIFKTGFKTSNVNPKKIIFEITETVISISQEHTLKTFKELQSLGVSLSIDDFGTGQSSLIYLKNLPISELKIDRGFVTSMVEKEQDFYIVQSIIHLAQGLNCRSVAEGIETEEVYASLKRMGCDIAQGYFIARPMPLQSLIIFLESD
jgi:EAL domain-containing protein (putative c-di-GMP-specific phosphodiesterase class I)